MRKTGLFKTFKIIAALIITAIMAMSFASCEETGNSSTGNSKTYEYIEEKVDKISKDTTIDENVIYDKDNIKITATSIEFQSSRIKLDLTIENNTNKNLTFLSGTMGYCCNAINEYMVADGYLNCEVSAGKKAMDSIYFNLDDLTFYGIDEIASIELGIEIKDDDYNSVYTEPLIIKTSEYGLHDLYTTYSSGSDSYQKTIKSRSAKKGLGYTVDYFSDETIYQNSDVSIVSAALITKDDEKHLFLEAVNNGSDIVNFRVQNFFINGLQVETGNWSTDNIAPDKIYISDLNLTSMAGECMEPFGLDEIGNVKLEIELLDTDYNTVADAQQITIPISKKYSYDSSGDEIYNKNNIRIISKGIVEDDSEYSDDMYVLWLVENNSNTDTSIRESGDSSSINGFMVDTSFYGKEIPAGEAAIVSLHLYDSNLDDINISSVDEITEFEMTLEIKDSNYNNIDEALIKVAY